MSSIIARVDATRLALSRSRHSHARFALSLSVLLAIVSASLISVPAWAQSQAVAIDIATRIAPRCGFSSAQRQTVNAPADLETAASLSVSVQLDCNTPYTLGVVAEHGALINLDAHDDRSGYAFQKAYAVSVTLDTDRGIVRSGRCAAAELVSGGVCGFAGASAGEGLNSGSGISIGKPATFKIEWPDQSALSNRLAPGRYRDTLTIVLGARA